MDRKTAWGMVGSRRNNEFPFEGRLKVWDAYCKCDRTGQVSGGTWTWALAAPRLCSRPAVAVGGIALTAPLDRDAHPCGSSWCLPAESHVPWVTVPLCPVLSPHSARVTVPGAAPTDHLLTVLRFGLLLGSLNPQDYSGDGWLTWDLIQFPSLEASLLHDLREL